MRIRKLFHIPKGKKYKGKNRLYIPPQTGNVSWYHICLLGSSVIPKVYFPVIIFCLWSAILKVVYDKYEGQKFIDILFFPVSLVTFSATVMSLLLVFRNNSAYDRFWEGRKAWGNIINQARNISRHIWIGINIDESDKNRDEKLNLKKGVMRLVIALVISIRHSLRGEFGWDYDDLAELVKHVPRFNSLITTAPKQVLKILPLEIAYHIEGYFYLQKDIPISLINPTYAALNSIIESYTVCERILTTPIPLIYGIHIKHVLIVYLLTLPLQIIKTCGWTSVAIVGLVAFIFLGIEAISSEIENPFGMDDNDLELEEFCQQIQIEINGIMRYFPSSIGLLDWLECEEIEEENSDALAVDIDEVSEDNVEISSIKKTLTIIKDGLYNRSRKLTRREKRKFSLNENDNNENPAADNP